MCVYRNNTINMENANLLIKDLWSIYGVANDKIIVSPSSCGGNGVFLTSDVKQNENVLKIPLEIIITEKIAVNSLVGKSIKQVWGENIPDRIILTLYLLHMKTIYGYSSHTKTNITNNNNSNTNIMKTYVNSLPNKYTTPTFIASMEEEADNGGLSTNILNRLTGTAVGNREKTRCVQMKETYNAIFPRLSQTFPSLFPAKDFSWEKYLWAHTSLATRLFPPTFCLPNNPNSEENVNLTNGNNSSQSDLPGGCMIPLADMLNHKAGTSLRWYTDDQFLYANTSTNMKMGDELTFSYGDFKSNGHLLVTYGFCQPFNPNDVAPINFSSANVMTSDKDVIESVNQYTQLYSVPLTVATSKRTETKIKIDSPFLICCRIFGIESKQEFELLKEKKFEAPGSVQQELNAIDVGFKLIQTSMSLLMGENESKLVELFHLMEGEACRILLPLSRNNASISSIYPMDDVSWYQFGQYKTLVHTENLLEMYKADLKLRGNHINHNNSNFDDRIIYNMKLAFAEARYALENGEVPVGCVFINSSNNSEDIIITAGSNKTNVTSNATRHAELVAYDIAFVASNCNKDVLKGSELYVTVEPCIMCAAALARIGVKVVYYGCSNDKFGGNGSILSCHRCGNFSHDLDCEYDVIPGVLETEAIELLREFYSRGNPNAPKPHRKVL